jgi:hypothetical protein
VGVGFVGNQVLESRSRKRPGKKKPVTKQALIDSSKGQVYSEDAIQEGIFA